MLVGRKTCHCIGLCKDIFEPSGEHSPTLTFSLGNLVFNKSPMNELYPNGVLVPIDGTPTGALALQTPGSATSLGLGTGPGSLGWGPFNVNTNAIRLDRFVDWSQQQVVVHTPVDTTEFTPDFAAGTEPLGAHSFLGDQMTLEMGYWGDGKGGYKGSSCGLSSIASQTETTDTLIGSNGGSPYPPDITVGPISFDYSIFEDVAGHFYDTEIIWEDTDDGGNTVTVVVKYNASVGYQEIDSDSIPYDGSFFTSGSNYVVTGDESFSAAQMANTTSRVVLGSAPSSSYPSGSMSATKRKNGIGVTGTSGTGVSIDARHWHAREDNRVGMEGNDAPIQIPESGTITPSDYFLPVLGRDIEEEIFFAIRSHFSPEPASSSSPGAVRVHQNYDTWFHEMTQERQYELKFKSYSSPWPSTNSHISQMSYPVSGPTWSSGGTRLGAPEGSPDGGVYATATKKPELAVTDPLKSCWYELSVEAGAASVNRPGDPLDTPITLADRDYKRKIDDDGSGNVRSWKTWPIALGTAIHSVTYEVVQTGSLQATYNNDERRTNSNVEKIYVQMRESVYENDPTPDSTFPWTEEPDFVIPLPATEAQTPVGGSILSVSAFGLDPYDVQSTKGNTFVTVDGKRVQSGGFITDGDPTTGYGAKVDGLLAEGDTSDADATRELS